MDETKKKASLLLWIGLGIGAVIFVAVIVLVFMLVGSKEETVQGNIADGEDSVSGRLAEIADMDYEDAKWYVGNSDEEFLELIMPETTLNAQELYDSITYIPEMFYGRYVLEYEEENLDAYRQEMDYWGEANFGLKGYNAEFSYTKIPYAIYAGPANMYWQATGFWSMQNRMTLYVQSEEGNLKYVEGVYSVSGNTLSFRPFVNYRYENGGYTYDGLMDTTIDYEFSFNGPYMTLSLDGKSVTLCSQNMTEDYEYCSFETYCATGTEMLDGIEYINVYQNDGYERFMVQLEGESDVYYATGVFGEDGLFTFSWTDKEGNVHAYQYLYFSCDKDGIILTDGENTYLYTEDWFVRQSGRFGSNISEEDAGKVETMTDEEVKEIAEKRQDLLTELTEAFAQAGIAVEVDAETGEMVLDSAILFGFDEAALSEEGDELLKQFWEIFVTIVCDEKYDNFISQIAIEGYTDSQGTYAYNLELSQARAQSVMDRCAEMLNDGTGGEKGSQLQNIMIASGHSFEALIYDEEGNEDAEASRRVVFKFMVNIDYAE